MQESDLIPPEIIKALQSIFYLKGHPLENSIVVLRAFMENKVWSKDSNEYLPNCNLYTNVMITKYKASLKEGWLETLVKNYGADATEHSKHLVRPQLTGNTIEDKKKNDEFDKKRLDFYREYLNGINSDYSILQLATEHSGSGPIGSFCQSCIEYCETQFREHYEEFRTLPHNVLLALILKTITSTLFTMSRQKSYLGELIVDKSSLLSLEQTAKSQSASPSREPSGSLPPVVVKGGSAITPRYSSLTRHESSSALITKSKSQFTLNSDTDNHADAPSPKQGAAKKNESDMASMSVAPPSPTSSGSSTPRKLSHLIAQYERNANKDGLPRTPPRTLDRNISVASLREGIHGTPRAHNLLTKKTPFGETPRGSVIEPLIETSRDVIKSLLLGIIQSRFFDMSSEDLHTPVKGRSDSKSRSFWDLFISNSDETNDIAPITAPPKELNDKLPPKFWTNEENFCVSLDRLIAILSKLLTSPTIQGDADKSESISNLIKLLNELKSWIIRKSEILFSIYRELENPSKKAESAISPAAAVSAPIAALPNEISSSFTLPDARTILSGAMATPIALSSDTKKTNPSKLAISNSDIARVPSAPPDLASQTSATTTPPTNNGIKKGSNISRARTASGDNTETPKRRSKILTASAPPDTSSNEVAQVSTGEVPPKKGSRIGGNSQPTISATSSADNIEKKKSGESTSSFGSSLLGLFGIGKESKHKRGPSTGGKTPPLVTPGRNSGGKLGSRTSSLGSGADLPASEQGVFHLEEGEKPATPAPPHRP